MHLLDLNIILIFYLYNMKKLIFQIFILSRVNLPLHLLDD